MLTDTDIGKVASAALVLLVVVAGVAALGLFVLAFLAGPLAAAQFAGAWAGKETEGDDDRA